MVKESHLSARYKTYEKLRYLEKNTINGGDILTPQKENYSIGDILRNYREYSTLTQAEIESIQEIPFGTISRIENSESIAYPIIFDMCHVLKLSNKQKEDILYRWVIQEYNIKNFGFPNNFKGLEAVIDCIQLDIKNIKDYLKN
jgi:transcriptional regulator with XRE-family HTH domain